MPTTAISELGLPLKKKHSTVFLNRTRKDRRQSDEHLNCFLGNAGEASDRRDGARVMGSRHIKGSK